MFSLQPQREELNQCGAPGKKGGGGGETTRRGGDRRAGTSSEIKRGLKWNEQEERGRTEVKGDSQ